VQLRQTVIACTFAVFMAAAIFASLPAVALADSAEGVQHPTDWGWTLFILIWVLIVSIPAVAVFVLFLFAVRACNSRREREWLESIRREEEQEYIRESEERARIRRELGEPKQEAGPWAGS